MKALTLFLTTVLVGNSERQVPGSTVEQRREAIRQAGASAQTAGEEIVPVIEAGLRDPDAQVRFGAIAALTQLVMRAARTPGPTEKTVNLRGRPTLGSAVVSALQDADFRIRGGAASALPFITDVSAPTVRSALVAQYQRESDGGVRAVILSVLAPHAGKNQDVQRLVVQGLDDMAPVVRRQAAMTIPAFRPPEALSRIVAELQAGNEQTRPEFVRALASYGALAKSHVGVLETLLAVETGRDRRDQINKAIQTINASR